MDKEKVIQCSTTGAFSPLSVQTFQLIASQIVVHLFLFIIPNIYSINQRPILFQQMLEPMEDDSDCERPVSK